MGEHRNSKGRIGGRTALVTGCNGFVGSYLAEFLIEEGWSVHGTLRSFRSDLKNLDQLRASGCGLELHRCDVVDYQAVADTVKAVRPDAIFHLAAQSVASDSLIPVMLSKSIQILPIDELFERNRRKNKLEVKTVHGIETEVIQLPARTQTKALGYWNGMGSWRRILQISRHRYSGHLVRLTQKWGSVTVTPNHCIYASDGGLTTPLTNPEMLAIRRVNYHAKESDMMRLKSPQFSPRGGFIVNSDNPESPCSVKQVLRGRDLLDFMKFVGAYVSEGCVHYRQNGKADVIISNGDLKWIHAVQGCLKTFFYGEELDRRESERTV